MLDIILGIVVVGGFYIYLFYKMYTSKEPESIVKPKDPDPFGEHFSINPNSADSKRRGSN